MKRLPTAALILAALLGCGSDKKVEKGDPEVARRYLEEGSREATLALDRCLEIHQRYLEAVGAPEPTPLDRDGTRYVAIPLNDPDWNTHLSELGKYPYYHFPKKYRVLGTWGKHVPTTSLWIYLESLREQLEKGEVSLSKLEGYDVSRRVEELPIPRPPRRKIHGGEDHL